MLAAQNLESQAGEDAARVIALQILNAQNAYRPLKSQKPTNWGNTRYRIDIALKGTSTTTTGWYGAFELKWVVTNSDINDVRSKIVQDVTRLSFVTTTNMCARVLVLGGTAEAFIKLFETTHPESPGREQRRQAFARLLVLGSAGRLEHAELIAHFANHASRVPENVTSNWDGILKTEFLSACAVCRGADVVGHVVAWQCLRTRGSVQNPVITSMATAQ